VVGDTNNLVQYCHHLLELSFYSIGKGDCVQAWADCLIEPDVKICLDLMLGKSHT